LAIGLDDARIARAVFEAEVEHRPHGLKDRHKRMVVWLA
jgi:hypothetical protein